MEKAVQDYLQWALQDERIMRMRLHGAKDIGDVGNVYFHGERVTLEVKNTSKTGIAGYLSEAEDEAGNNGSPYPIVVQKRRGVGIDSMAGIGNQYVFMTLSTLARLLNSGIELGPDKKEDSDEDTEHQARVLAQRRH
jgi:hypothetical protein